MLSACWPKNQSYAAAAPTVAASVWYARRRMAWRRSCCGLSRNAASNGARELRHVEERAEALVDEAPARRRAVVVARIVRRAQRAQRRLDEARARIDLDRLEAGGQVGLERRARPARAPGQRARAARAILDAHLDGLEDVVALARDVDRDVDAAGGVAARRDPDAARR